MENIPATVVERFWRHTRKTADSYCWLWTGGCDGRGYGRIKIKDKSIGAHRLSFEIHNGKIPDGLCVLHSCDNPPCVNPGHLSAGTQLDNLADCRAKGRARLFGGGKKGEAHGRAKLSNRKVMAIRRSPKTLTALAKQYGVHAVTISQVRTRKTWNHIS